MLTEHSKKFKQIEIPGKEQGTGKAEQLMCRGLYKKLLLWKFFKVVG